jgi:AraC-like DNA-binding protein
LLIPILGTSFYLIGPVLFLYVRSVITDDHHLHRSDLWHLFPVGIFFLAALPALFQPFGYVAEAADAIVQNPDAIGNYKPSMLSSLISYPALFLSRPILIFAYTCAAIIMLINYLLKHDKTSVFSGQSFMTKWLIILLGSFFFLVASHILILFDFTTGTFNLQFLLKTLRIISVAGLSGLLVSPFFFPGILYGLPRLPGNEIVSGKENFNPLIVVNDNQNSGNQKQEIEEETKTLKIEKKNAAPGFETDYITLISSLIEECMQEFQPYLQQDFNLTQLSVLVKIPVHHLAYYFREVKKQTFSDYRNAWRVKHAKNLIREGKSSDLTLEAIGILSGFSSRNTFLIAFKKAEGISPQAFLQQVKKK